MKSLYNKRNLIKQFQFLETDNPNTKMKTKIKINGYKTALIAGLLSLGMAVNSGAQLLHYYQFSTDTANDQVGTANGTLLNGAAITGGALVTQGGNGAVSGQWGGSGPMMTLDSSAVSGITGGFTIVDWFSCSTGWPKYDTAYAFSDGTQNNYLLGNPVQGYSPWPSGVGIAGGGGYGHYQDPNSDWCQNVLGIYLDTGSINQTVLTYDGTTFSYYVDGVLANYNGLASTAVDPGFNLSTLTDIALNGGSPFGDPALTGSTYSFSIYGQALTATQVADVYGLGDNANPTDLANVVPEPGTTALAMVGGIGLLFFRRRQAKQS